MRFISYKKVLHWYSGLVKAKPKEAPYKHIVQIGDPNLRAVSEPVPIDFIQTKEMKNLVDLMISVLRKYNSVGLSAPQIGIPLRVFLMEFNDKHLKYYSKNEIEMKQIEKIPLTVVVNPEIKVLDYRKVIFAEACESIRGFWADVPRFQSVQLTSMDLNGQKSVIEAKGWTARIIQHEIDHLNGKVYTDIMDPKTLTCSCWKVINERAGKVELPYGA